MMNLRTLRIGARLGSAFGLLATLLLLMGVGALMQLASLHRAVEDLGDNWLPSIQRLGELNNAMTTARRAGLRAALESDPTRQAQVIELHDQWAKTRVPAAAAAYEKLISSDEERKLYQDIMAAWGRFTAAEDKVFAALRAGQADEARALTNGDTLTLFNEVNQLLDKDIALNAKGADDSRTAAHATYARAQQIIAALLVLALGTAALLAWRITRSITQPLSESLRVAETIAQGDLSARYDTAGKDEPAHLLQALRHMNDRLLEVVTQVRQSSESVSTGASEIATGNADLSQRTEEQAANLEETAASMEELTATVRTSGDTARQAAQLATSACQSATQGGEVVRRVVDTMGEISLASRKIADIIGVIDGIAFQTNILALNAAVEAARAGEQGRGFAVVAGEVRTLASRSAEAAREIKQLIAASVERVESGTSLVGEAGGQIESLVHQVQRVSDLISEIAAAANEQAVGIAQVNTAVGQLDQVTQQNAALVEESAAAADSLNHQSRQLVDLVGTFKISGAAPAAPAASRPAAPRAAARPPAPRPAATPTAHERKASEVIQQARRPAAPVADAPATAGTPHETDWESF